MSTHEGHKPMSSGLEPHAHSSQPTVYQIRISGELDAGWADWFEGLTITLDGGDTLITGPVVDQPALHGVLKKVRDLGLSLLSISPARADGMSAPAAPAIEDTGDEDRP